MMPPARSQEATLYGQRPVRRFFGREVTNRFYEACRRLVHGRNDWPDSSRRLLEPGAPAESPLRGRRWLSAQIAEGAGSRRSGPGVPGIAEDAILVALARRPSRGHGLLSHVIGRTVIQDHWPRPLQPSRSRLKRELLRRQPLGWARS